MTDFLQTTQVDLLTTDTVAEVLTFPDTALDLLTVGVQGPPGPVGPIGPAGGQVLSRDAGQTLSALTVVYEDALGTVHALDLTDGDHIFLLLGVTLTAADVNRPVSVQRSGIIDDSSWAWSPGQRVYLGVGGTLTPDPTDSGFHVLIGTALSPTRLLLNIQDPIEMATEAEGE